MTALDQRRSEPADVATPLERPEARGHDRTPPTMLAILLAAHGIAHFVGVVAAFDAIEANEELGYLGGTWMIGNDLLIGLLGMLWATIGLAFVFAAVAVITEFRGWERSVILLGTLSTALCVLALWAAWVGIVVNAVIVTVAMVSNNDRLPGPPRAAI